LNESPQQLATNCLEVHGIPERIPELDGLRGVAVLVVVLHHISQSFPEGAVGGTLRLWLAVTHAGWTGVDIFFALSGFLITRILLGTRNRPHYYRNFYARRVLRLMPPYLIMLVLIATLVPGSGRFLALSVVYLANFSALFGIPMSYGPLWSLAIEEHYYLIWPWLVRFLNRRVLAAVGILLCFSTPVFRYYAQTHGFFNPYFSWFRFDGLMWGSLSAVVVTAPNSSRRIIRWWSVTVGSIGAFIYVVGAMMGAMGRNSLLGSTIVFGAVAMATTGVIGLAALGELRALWAPLRSRVLRYLGDISYWIYLIHALIVETACTLAKELIADRHLTVDWSVCLAITAIVAVLVVASGAMVRRWVEMPFLRLKQRFR
jgi:peptidoglycan/LPS O-acetylase OafA/YrhL